MNKPYLNDEVFLKQFDLEQHKTQYIQIKVLDYQTEMPIASIEGKSTAGSCNLSGTSNMRRAANCTLVVDPEGIKINGKKDFQQYYNITEIENLISLNKKVRIDTGFINTLKEQFDNRELNINKKINFFVEDSVGKKYTVKSKTILKELIQEKEK